MSLRDLWTLDTAVTFLNHGSYGACPRAVLDVQAEYRARMERQPVQFLGRDAEPLLAEAREVVGGFLGVPGKDIGFVTNATGGVNTVLRSLRFEPGDELMITVTPTTPAPTRSNGPLRMMARRSLSSISPCPYAATKTCSTPSSNRSRSARSLRLSTT